MAKNHQQRELDHYNNNSKRFPNKIVYV